MLLIRRQWELEATVYDVLRLSIIYNQPTHHLQDLRGLRDLSPLTLCEKWGLGCQFVLRLTSSNKESFTFVGHQLLNLHVFRLYEGGLAPVGHQWEYQLLRLHKKNKYVKHCSRQPHAPAWALHGESQTRNMLAVRWWCKTSHNHTTPTVGVWRKLWQKTQIITFTLLNL